MIKFCSTRIYFGTHASDESLWWWTVTCLFLMVVYKGGWGYSIYILGSLWHMCFMVGSHVQWLQHSVLYLMPNLLCKSRWLCMRQREVSLRTNHFRFVNNIRLEFTPFGDLFCRCALGVGSNVCRARCVQHVVAETSQQTLCATRVGSTLFYSMNDRIGKACFGRYSLSE